MKILLIYPPTNKKVVGGDMVFLHEPLSLEYLGAAVKENHDVKILDMRIQNNFEDSIKNFDPDVIGVTGFTVHVKTCKAILKSVKNIKRNAFTVVGGPHASALPEDFYEDYIDAVVIGEGVLPFKKIIERRDKNIEIGRISGTAVKKNGIFYKTPPEPYPGLDALPFPDRSLTSEYRDKYFTPLMKPLASIKSSIGCNFKCNYCMLWKITDGRFIPRNNRKILDEIASIKESNIFFADDDSLCDADIMIELANLIKNEGIKKRYQVNAGSNTISKRPEVIERWRDIGLTSVVMGFESYRDEDFEYYNRKTKTTTNEKALAVLRENDVIPIGYFIVRPDYTRKNFEELKNYIRKLNLRYLIFTVLTPIPGSDLFKETKSQLIKNDYDLYDFRHTLLPTKLPLEEFYSELARLFEGVVPRWKGILRLFENPLHQIFSAHLKNKMIINELKNAYKDY